MDMWDSSRSQWSMTCAGHPKGLTQSDNLSTLPDFNLVLSRILPLGHPDIASVLDHMEEHRVAADGEPLVPGVE